MISQRVLNEVILKKFYELFDYKLKHNLIYITLTLR